jgi:endonuclease/exonuclease/phosphatase family metal-dependent hydrolase
MKRFVRAALMSSLARKLSTGPLRFGTLLSEIGLNHVADTLRLATNRMLLTGPRRNAILIASRWPLVSLPSAAMPWTERLLSVRVNAPSGAFQVHAAHIPPAASNGWMKIDTLDGIYAYLARPCEPPRILCGDFNTPQHEGRDGHIVTWAARSRSRRPHAPARAYAQTAAGDYRLRRNRGERWDRGERNILEGLVSHDLCDVFRELRGWDISAFSWYANHRRCRQDRRFDHVFASKQLNAVRCESGLSDHSPIEVDFSLPVIRNGAGQ